MTESSECAACANSQRKDEFIQDLIETVFSYRGDELSDEARKDLNLQINDLINSLAYIYN
jgi:hypothetical protein